MSYAIEAADLGKRYPAAWALREVALQASAGQVIGLLGHNGAGKSTLIRLMLGLIQPSQGTIAMLGADPCGPQARALRRRIGYLPEHAAFYGNLTGREILDYFAALKGVSARGNGALLERVGLADAADRRERTYSKGMRQRLGLAQALLGDPELLLLDEPTSGLDPIATRDFFTLIDVLRTQGRTVVISSHVLPELEPHIDRAIILGHGRLLAQGSVASLQAATGAPVTIAVRFADAQAVQQGHLQALGSNVARRGADTFELDVAREAKLAAVRGLMQLPGIVDIEVHEAPLSQIYAAIGAAAQEVAA